MCLLGSAATSALLSPVKLAFVAQAGAPLLSLDANSTLVAAVGAAGRLELYAAGSATAALSLEPGRGPLSAVNINPARSGVLLSAGCQSGHLLLYDLSVSCTLPVYSLHLEEVASLLQEGRHVSSITSLLFNKVE